jgi:uncharacterized surface protein with fasciclin (FAS1) repeats
MKNQKMTHLALLISLAASPLVLAQKPADKTTPERKMQTEEKVVVTPTTTTTAIEEKVVVVPATPAVKQGSLTDLVTVSVTFSTLKAALKAAELDVTLGQKGVYTLFAPTDEAFDKLPVGTLGKLMLPENKEKLRSLLLYHVIPGQMLAVDLKDGLVTTMNGEKVKIKVDDGNVDMDDARVFSTDVMANNGVMHSIGTVMIPKSMEGFSGLDK